MAPSLYPEYPPKLSKEQEEYILSSLKDWTIAHGLAVRPPATFAPVEKDSSGVLAIPAPVTLFPSPFPRVCFEDALAIQTHYNDLYAAIANDERWLGEIVEEIVEVDDFIANLWEVHKTVKKEGYVQDISLGLFRSDYMVHVDPSGVDKGPGLRQVEFNTIASSFGGLAAGVSGLHRHLLDISAYPPESLVQNEALPSNDSMPALARGLATSHQHYGPSKSQPSLPLCVLIVVQDSERNVFDQRHVEYALRSNHKIPIFRLPFTHTMEQTRLGDSGSRPLIFKPTYLGDIEYEVTTVYYRAGYSPSEYESQKAWDARLHLERSAAIKCPSILTHLAGSKKIQQVLATPNSPHLARFLSHSAEATKQVQQTFASIYPLDSSPAGQQARNLALNPETAQGYVLKPQREGGGNNIYRTAIPDFLRSIPESSWKGYVLMEIIEPPALTNTIYRNGELMTGGVIGELGVFGVCLWRDKAQASQKDKATCEILSNLQGGYLLRTKGHESEEGGVAAGFGCIDSCLLVDV